MRVLVTGAGGFVGRHVVPHLAAQGHNVRALVHQPPLSPLFHGGVDVVSGDITDREDIHRALEGNEAVVHLAAILREGPKTFEEVNVSGPRVIVEGCVAQGAGRMIHISALGAAPDSPSTFLRSKWHGEEMVRRSDLEWTIVRASLILGPGSGFGLRMKRVLRGRGPAPVIGRGRNLVQPVHVADVAELVSFCLKAPSTFRKVLEVGGPQPVTMEELTRAFARVAGRNERLVRIPWAVALPAAGILQLLSKDPPVTPDEVRMAVQDNHCDNGPLAALGFSPRLGLEEQIRDSLAS